MRPIAITIAGSDPSGGAGLQAALKTFHQFGVFGASVVTLLTVQNTQGVDDVQHLSPNFARSQFNAVDSDLRIAAAKTGALGTMEMIRAVAECVRKLHCPVVVDPVMVSKHGHPLIEVQAVDALRDTLIPAAYLVTPNRYEAEQLTGISVTGIDSMKEAATRIQQLGAKNVLLKGGCHAGMAVDVLLADDQCVFLKDEHFVSSNTHGSGCVLSAALTSSLALGLDLVSAARTAKDFVTRGIVHAESIGCGQGPLNLHVAAKKPC